MPTKMRLHFEQGIPPEIMKTPIGGTIRFKGFGETVPKELRILKRDRRTKTVTALEM